MVATFTPFLFNWIVSYVSDRSKLVYMCWLKTFLLRTELLCTLATDDSTPVLRSLLQHPDVAIWLDELTQ